MPVVAEIVLRLVGALYVLAGAALMRHLVMDHVLDQALSGLTLKPVPGRDRMRRWLLGTCAVALGMGGAALMVLSIWAVPLFLFVAGNQTAYFLWARVAFPPEANETSTGGRKGLSASAFYGGITLLVCWLGFMGQLHPWFDPLALFVPLAGSAILLGIGHHFFWRARPVGAWDAPEPPPPEPLAPPRAVVLAPAWGGRVLVDADRDDWLDYDLFVPPALSERIYLWGQAFHAGEDYDSREFWVQFIDLDHETAHRAEGEAIVGELRHIFGDAQASGPDYPSDVRYGVPPL